MNRDKLRCKFIAMECRGFASLLRSGEMLDRDHVIVARQFDKAADMLEQLSLKIWGRDLNERV